MRLTDIEVSALIAAIDEHVKLNDAQLRLYGSRAKDHLKGGDIDLLLVLPNLIDYKNVLSKKIEILVGMKEKIGDQKIDFTLANRQEMNSDPFVNLIYGGSLLLHQWVK